MLGGLGKIGWFGYLGLVRDLGELGQLGYWCSTFDWVNLTFGSTLLPQQSHVTAYVLRINRFIAIREGRHLTVTLIQPFNTGNDIFCIIQKRPPISRRDFKAGSSLPQSRGDIHIRCNHLDGLWHQFPWHNLFSGKGSSPQEHLFTIEGHRDWTFLRTTDRGSEPIYLASMSSSPTMPGTQQKRGAATRQGPRRNRGGSTADPAAYDEEAGLSAASKIGWISQSSQLSPSLFGPVSNTEEHRDRAGSSTGTRSSSHPGNQVRGSSQTRQAVDPTRGPVPQFLIRECGLWWSGV